MAPGIPRGPQVNLGGPDYVRPHVPGHVLCTRIRNKFYGALGYTGHGRAPADLVMARPRSGSSLLPQNLTWTSFSATVSSSLTLEGSQRVGVCLIHI